MDLSTPEGAPVRTDATRRAALASLFCAGYAAAVGSAAASAIVTDEEGLLIDEVRFPAHGDYALPAYLARPKARGRAGAIVVVNEIFGVHAYIRDVCRRLAKLGYVALAPDYFDRSGDPSILPMGEAAEMARQARYEQVMGDTDAAARFLRRQRFVADERLGITGFCWGGGVVWMAAARSRAFRAGVAWYGRLAPVPPDQPWHEPGRKYPTEVAGQLMAPVLGLYGGMDQAIPVADVEAMRTALDLAGNPSGSEIVVYPDAGHAFHADYRPSYAPQAAEDGWRRMLEWFAAHGVSARR